MITMLKVLIYIIFGIEKDMLIIISQGRGVCTSLNKTSIFLFPGIDLMQNCANGEDRHAILQLALLRVLRVANGHVGLNDEDISERDSVDPEIWAPASLFRALRAHRWVINTDEQDAHEFFQVCNLMKIKLPGLS